MNIGKNISFNIGRSIGQIDAMAVFASLVGTDGGIIEGTLLKEGFNSMDVKFRNQASLLLIPGAYKIGKVYGMNPVTGAIVPFNFSRAGAATYFDKNGVMQTSVANMPRIDYDPVTKECKGYLIEGASTNLLVSSSTEPWTPTKLTKVPNTTFLCPNGTYAGVKIIANSEAVEHFLSPGGIAVADNTIVTLSVFLKAGEVSLPRIQGKTKSDLYPSAEFNLITGTITSVGSPVGVNATADIKSVGNGWFRCSLTWNVLSGAQPTITVFIFPNKPSSSAGDDVKGLYVWGAQLEPGSVATSYIPTLSAQVTRVVETLNARTNVITPNPLTMSEATLYCQYDTVFESNFPRLIYLTKDTDIVDIGARGTIISKNGSTLFSYDDPTGLPTAKVATAYKIGSAARAKNGSIMYSGTPIDFPVVDVNISIGSVLGSTNRILFGHVKVAAIIPSRLTNSELQTLTA